MSKSGVIIMELINTKKNIVKKIRVNREKFRVSKYYFLEKSMFEKDLFLKNVLGMSHLKKKKRAFIKITCFSVFFMFLTQFHAFGRKKTCNEFKKCDIKHKNSNTCFC